MGKKLTNKEVEIFLLKNKDFFINHPSLVSELNFKHGAGSASSLLERQVQSLRDEQSNLMSLLTRFIETAKSNEELFEKTKDLVIKIVASKSVKELIKETKEQFLNNFDVSAFEIELLNSKQQQDFIKESGIALKPNNVYMGTFSLEKMEHLFGSKKIKSAVVCAFKVKNNLNGIIKFGSSDASKYLGDEGSAFIEYIRDVIAAAIRSLK